MRRAVLFALGLAWAAASAAGEAPSGLDRLQARALADPASHRQPTIVALWSSECGHCKTNLAAFAALVRAEPQIRLVTIAAEPAAPELAGPLDRLQVPGPRYAWGDGSPEALAYALDPKWRGELPRTLFFDGRGGVTAVSGVVAETAARRALGR